jgi:glycosyltransferase involved in cell wall biosynthesis
LKSVLYISYDGMTDPLGQSQVIPYMTGLARLGHRITVLSCEKPGSLRELGDTCRQVFDEFGINWHHIRYSKRPPILSTLYDLARMYRLGLSLAKRHNFDIVHCRTVIPMLPGHRIARRYGTKLVFDTRSFWTDERVEGGLWNLANPVYRGLYAWFKKREEMFYREADLLLTLTQRARDHISDFGMSLGFQLQVHVVPCCVDTKRFSPDQIQPDQIILRRTLGLQGAPFVLLYLGSLGTRYMLKEMLEFFSVIRRENPGARFLFINRDEHALIRTAANKLAIPIDALVIAPSTYYDVPAMISLADAAVFFIHTGVSGKAVSPAKQAELMSMGIRIVCNSGIGDCDEIVGATGAGIVLEELSQRGYVEAAARLKEPVGLSAAEIRDVAEARLSLGGGIERYHEAWESL